MMRAAEDPELDDAARQIARAMVSDTRFIGEYGPFTQIGPYRGHGIHRKILLKSLEAGARQVLSEAIVLVLEVDGEPVGWVALKLPTDATPLTVVFIHVIDLVRRHGFGRRLLAEALLFGDDRPPRFSYMTQAGAALLESKT